MTTYTAIANTEIDADSPITTTLMQSMRDNPIAISEGSTGAPYLSSAWHPYDGVIVGDSDGAIYDFAVDGAVAEVETPNFADGYEYMIRFAAVLGTSAAAAFYGSLYQVTGASYQANTTLAIAYDTTVNAASGMLYLPYPRLSAFVHASEWVKPLSTASAGDISVNTLEHTGIAETFGKARFKFSSGNVNGGKIYLYRRREFITG